MATSENTNGQIRSSSEIVRRATRLAQTESSAIYQFALTGTELLAVAEFSRLSRDDAGKLIGYQRPEVKRHVQDIVTYLDGDAVLFPHAVIVAFSSRVKFVGSRGPNVNDGVASAGELHIPRQVDGEPKPGWIVDGQQRALAVAKSKRPNLPIPVCAFITDDVEVQREQFLRINNSKPLPKGLVTELLPEVSVPISIHTAANKLPSSLVNTLNEQDGSPFYRLIKRTSSSPDARRIAVIPDGPLIKVLRTSLMNPAGCLFPYRNVATGEADVDSIWRIIVAYWSAVKQTFPDAWGRPPQESRLMHSAGLWAMGRLMDRIVPTVSLSTRNLVGNIAEELDLMSASCRWTSGSWEALGLTWNRVENVPRHLNALSNFLVRTYVAARAAKDR